MFRKTPLMMSRRSARQTARTLLTLGALLLLLPACSDLLENPQGSLAPESFFQNVRDARSAMDGAYGLLASERVYGRKFYLTVELLSDDADIGNPGTAGRRVEINDYTMGAGNGMVNVFWPNMYEAISASNLVVDRVQDNANIDPVQGEPIVGEARFLRSLVYFHLVRLFGPVPYLTEFVSDPASVADEGRTPVDEVYAGIVEDLEEAISVLPLTHSGGIKSRATKGAAQTLLAKVHLTRGNWSEAARLAEEVIGSGEYTLAEDFATLYNPANGDTEEHIFTVDFLGGVAAGGGANDDMWAVLPGVRNADMNGWGVNVPTLKFYESFHDEDYRKRVSFLDSTYIGGELVPYTEYPQPTERRPHIGKWVRIPGENAQATGRVSDHNIPVFRYAETLLIAAEALNEANGGPTPAAYDYLNEVRQRARNGGSMGAARAYPPDLTPPVTQEAFREAVHEERRIELAFEIKRWFDLVRTNRVMEFLGDPETALEYHETTDDFVNNRNALLPLPGDEVARNPNLEQNPGY